MDKGIKLNPLKSKKAEAFKKILLAKLKTDPAAALPDKLNKSELLTLLTIIGAAKQGDKKQAAFVDTITTSLPRGKGMSQYDRWIKYSFWVGVAYLGAVGVVELGQMPSANDIMGDAEMRNQPGNPDNLIEFFDSEADKVMLWAAPEVYGSIKASIDAMLADVPLPGQTQVQ